MWLGYPMIAALVYSALPAVLLGRAKLPLAETLHNKVRADVSPSATPPAAAARPR